MARTYVKPGHILTFTAPAGGVVSGTPLLIGALVVIPTVTAAAGLAFEGMVSGVQSVPKADSQAWTEGAKVYWDDTGKCFTTVASGNTDTGTVAVAAVASTGGLVIGTVLLNGKPGPSNM